MKDSTSLVEWCWGIVGDKGARARAWQNQLETKITPEPVNTRILLPLLPRFHLRNDPREHHILLPDLLNSIFFSTTPWYHGEQERNLALDPLDPQI